MQGIKKGHLEFVREGGHGEILRFFGGLYTYRERSWNRTYFEDGFSLDLENYLF
jgi:hypothetical protein